MATVPEFSHVQRGHVATVLHHVQTSEDVFLGVRDGLLLLLRDDFREGLSVVPDELCQIHVLKAALEESTPARNSSGVDLGTHATRSFVAGLCTSYQVVEIDSTARTLGTMASAVCERELLEIPSAPLSLALAESHNRSQDRSSWRQEGAQRSRPNHLRADRPFGNRSTGSILPQQTADTSERTSPHGAGCVNLRRLALSPPSPSSPTGAYLARHGPGSERRRQNAAPSRSPARASANKTTCARYPRARCQLIE